MGELLWVVFALVAVAVSYTLGVQRGRAEDYVSKDRAEAVAECSHALAELECEAHGMPASYLLAVHDAHRVVVERWLAELDVDACDPGAVVEALRKAPTHREPDPASVEVVDDTSQPAMRSWLLNTRHVPR